VKILLVGMADSIHVSRWLSQFDNTSIRFELVSSSPHRKLSPGIARRLYRHSNLSMPWLSRYFSEVMWWADRFLSDWVRGAYIFWRIQKFKPDIVHVHELQNAGYATRRAFQLLGPVRPKLLVSNYGSDIYWFARIPKHRKILEAILRIADGYSAECERDYKLANSIASGFQSLPLMPITGGLPRGELKEVIRKKIAVKGYENLWGKALVVLETLGDISDELRDYEVVFFGSNKSVVLKAQKVKASTGLKIVTHGNGALSHNQVLELFSESIIYIGHSLSDGISTSMLEAMSMGSIPIQTCTSCAEEWIQDNRTGFIVRPYDKEAIQRAVLAVVRGEFDSDYARTENRKVIDQRYDTNVLSRVALSYYETLKFKTSKT